MQDNYIIIHLDRAGEALEAVNLSRTHGVHEASLLFTIDRKKAIRLNKEEAKATIEFITNVIDWEEGEQLYILRVPD